MTFEATRGGFGYESPVQGETNDWWTPPEIVAKLGRFDLDPCAGVGQEPLADRVYVPSHNDQDGLALPWEGRVFCNPPYGPNVGDWAEKMAEHGNGILLIFARVETKAWRKIWATADGILFPFRRITFLRPGGDKAKSGTAPSAFCAYGWMNVEALRLCGIEGALVTGVEITSTEMANMLFGGPVETIG
jgi:DNA N-6-adenine-methyltransferase (Dam)